MSWNHNISDLCSYKYQLAETIGPGIYQLTRPYNQTAPMLPQNPRYVTQSSGVSISKNTSLIDIDSELIGISRNLSNCPDRKYMPTANDVSHCSATTGKVRNGIQQGDKLSVNNSQVLNFGDNGLWTEDTLLGGARSTLRGTGINRFEWLPMNPQERILHEFDYQINTKILSKDNHRPCIPKPLNQNNSHPSPNNIPICDTIIPETAYSYREQAVNRLSSEHALSLPVATVITSPPSVSWREQSYIAQY